VRTALPAPRLNQVAEQNFQLKEEQALCLQKKSGKHGLKLMDRFRSGISTQPFS
jgi:hypothetical protein